VPLCARMPYDADPRLGQAHHATAAIASIAIAIA
jgi:hypothetical protein